jgi:hypothetical protein
LCNLIEKYPKFLEKRPIVIDSWENPVIIAGNMRYQAIKKLRMKEIPASWVVTAENLTQEEKEAFMLVDNNNLGQWDFEMLANEFDIAMLDDLSIFIPNLNMPGQEIDEEGIEETGSVAKVEKDTDNVQVRLSFTPDEFALFNERIYDHGKTMEAGIIALLTKPKEG